MDWFIFFVALGIIAAGAVDVYRSRSRSDHVAKSELHTHDRRQNTVDWRPGE